MPAYVILGKLREKGAQDLSAVRKSHDAVDAAIAKVGGRLIARYHLLGEYDDMVAVEFPGEADVLRGAAATAMAGLTRSVACRAFTGAEFDAAISSAKGLLAAP
jgi:uncharacterized protein with GYD domain